MEDVDRRRELGRFLRARRNATKPAEVGLPDAGRRRTPGLRREEVANLSGVGVTWYTWLEQGREILASPQVIDALARALALDDSSHRHLRALADLSVSQPPSEPGGRDPALGTLLESLLPNPACAIDSHFDYVAWNRGYVAIWRSPLVLAPARRNLIWAFFTDPFMRDLVLDWESRARALLAQFRAAAGRHAGDPRFAELTEALNRASLEFRTWWPQYQVGEFTGTDHDVHHPRLGAIGMHLSQLNPATHPGLIVVLQTPRTAQDRRKLVSLLALNPQT